MYVIYNEYVLELNFPDIYIYMASMKTHQGDSRVPICHLDNLSGIPH